LIELFGTVEKTMEAHAMGIRLTPDEMLDVFGDDDPTEHASEAEQRWGHRCLPRVRATHVGVQQRRLAPHPF
jgi:hypothetical protein